MTPESNCCRQQGVEAASADAPGAVGPEIDARQKAALEWLAMNLPERPAKQFPETIADINDLRQRFVDAIEHLDQGIMMIDATNKVAVVNQRVVELLDIPADVLRSMPSFEALIQYQHARGEFDSMGEAFRSTVVDHAHEHEPGIFIRKRPNGSILEVRTCRLANGGAIRTYLDVTEREQRSDALAAAEAEYRGLFENSVVGIYRSSLDGRQIRANPALVRLNGYTSEAEQIAGVNDIGTEWYVDPARRDEFRALMARDGKVTDFVSEIYRHKTRERIWISESAWVVRDSAGRPCCYEGTVIDATERIQSERRIIHMARHDALTNLPNRTYFLDCVRKRLKRGRSAGRFAVMCVDLDRFKEVNDTLGHGAGDTLLRSAARRLASIAGEHDVISRLGGDEFAILVDRAADEGSIMAFADEVLGALSRPYSIGGQRAMIGASMGIALSGRHGDDPSELLKNADIALYKAKREGRQRACFFLPELTAALQRRRMIEVNLRSALANGEFELHYQPIVDVMTGEAVSHEALLRWHQPTMGRVSPAEFIPVAEETGLMIPIGEWILRQACEDAVKLLGGKAIAVNLSPVQLRSPNLLGAVVNALASCGLPAHKLELEITETVLLSDNRVNYDTLNYLKALGIRIALDDFGTGYSSLSYLQKFTFDKIKIDRSFVTGGQPGSTGAAVVKAVILLATELGMDVVAEGVETSDQVETLHLAGCRLMQGYLFGRPAALARPHKPDASTPVHRLRNAAENSPCKLEPSPIAIPRGPAVGKRNLKKRA